MQQKLCATFGVSHASRSRNPGTSGRCRLQVNVVNETGRPAVKPQRFVPRKDKVVDLASSVAGQASRGLMGLIAAGYSFKFERDDDPSRYTIARVGGWKFVESSEVGSFPRPAQPIEIYEFQGCPFCKKVRDVVDYLNIDVLYFPCPRDGPNWRPKANAEGGKKQFPYMKDPNTGKAMYESDDIIRYLVDTYGDGKVPGGLAPNPLTALTCALSLIPRLGRGSKYTPSKVTADTKPIEYYSYEGSPFCKIVREVLCELEIPHVHHSMSRGSPKRQEFYDKHGLFQVPYIEDPNTGVNMFESAEIIDYLRETYGK